VRRQWRGKPAGKRRAKDEWKEGGGKEDKRVEMKDGEEEKNGGGGWGERGFALDGARSAGGGGGLFHQTKAIMGKSGEEASCATKEKSVSCLCLREGPGRPAQ